MAAPANLFSLTVFLLSTRAVLAQVECTVSPQINCFADFLDGKTRLFASDTQISGKVTCCDAVAIVGAFCLVYARVCVHTCL